MRANIVIKRGPQELWFYRHSDGHPHTVLPSLNKFLDWVKEGKIRSDLSQSAGWLIMLGNTEYGVLPIPDGSSWKVGAYEPTTGQHGDIEYLYTIDLVEKTITHLNLDQIQAIELLEEKKEKLKGDLACDADGFPIDGCAFEYCGDIEEAIEKIKKGGDIKEIMGNI